MMDQNEIRTQNCLSHLVLELRRKYIIMLIHCGCALKKMITKRKTAKKGSKKEKGKVRKEKKNVREDKSVSPPCRSR